RVLSAAASRSSASPRPSPEGQYLDRRIAWCCVRFSDRRTVISLREPQEPAEPFERISPSHPAGAIDSGFGQCEFQILRRSWATLYAQVERDPTIPAQLAGHAVDVHENEYRQALPQALKKSMNK